MLDTTTAMSGDQAWTETLARGDVVLFLFPSSDEGRIKPRPCLVLEVGCIGDHAFAELAYGTSAMTKANVGYEIHVRKPDGMAAAGVDRPTRFVCSRRIIASLGSKGFHRPAASFSPVIGRLDADGLVRMDALRARIWAEKDIAADRREQVRRERSEAARSGADVVIRWRRSREEARLRADQAERRRSVR